MMISSVVEMSNFNCSLMNWIKVTFSSSYLYLSPNQSTDNWLVRKTLQIFLDLKFLILITLQFNHLSILMENNLTPNLSC